MHHGLTRAEFERVVEEALESLPKRFAGTGNPSEARQFALAKVIMLVRVTVTYLVVTGGPPPAMCQAA